MTQFPDLFAALAAPFEAEEVRVRAQAGRQLHYITARTAMNRLDDVLGPENWWDDYTPAENSVLCRLSIRLPDGQVVTKADAGGYAGMSDSGDDDKSGFSDAFKRASAKFGVARYLYRDGVPAFVREREAIRSEEPLALPAPAAVEQLRERFPDKLKPAASINGNGHHHENGNGVATAAPPRPSSNGNGRDSAPRNGKALFGWVKDQEQRHEIALLKYLNQWAKLQDFPGRMIEWDADQVALGFGEACRKLKSIGRNGGDEALSN